MEPNDRIRYNSVDCRAPDEPGLRDLGHFARDFSTDLLTWSHQLKRLGETLVADESFPEGSACEQYGETRKIIQNNMDSARYLSPLCAKFSEFIIPLGSSAPRKLGIVDHSRLRRGGNPGPS